jgi:hypothetical protein
MTVSPRIHGSLVGYIQTMIGPCDLLTLCLPLNPLDRVEHHRSSVRVVHNHRPVTTFLIG